MPIFEYECLSCGFVNEALVKSADVKPPACPQCGHKKTQKKFSSFSAVVKSPAPTPGKCQTCPNAGGCPSFQN